MTYDPIKTIKSATNQIAKTFLPIDLEFILIGFDQTKLISQGGKISVVLHQSAADTLFINMIIFINNQIMRLLSETEMQLIINIVIFNQILAIDRNALPHVWHQMGCQL